MIRLMVRSFEGWQYFDSTHGPCWERRAVWSTWLHYPNEEEARKDAMGFAESLIPFAVISEDQYPSFCASHRVW